MRSTSTEEQCRRRHSSTKGSCPTPPRTPQRPAATQNILNKRQRARMQPPQRRTTTNTSPSRGPIFRLRPAAAPRRPPKVTGPKLQKRAIYLTFLLNLGSQGPSLLLYLRVYCEESSAVLFLVPGRFRWCRLQRTSSSQNGRIYIAAPLHHRRGQQRSPAPPRPGESMPHPKSMFGLLTTIVGQRVVDQLSIYLINMSRTQASTKNGRST